MIRPPAQFHPGLGSAGIRKRQADPRVQIIINLTSKVCNGCRGKFMLCLTPTIGAQFVDATVPQPLIAPFRISINGFPFSSAAGAVSHDANSEERKM
jgi:hypothetical protein